MGYYYSPEEREKRAKEEIAARRETAAQFPLVREVIQGYDRKVYNCRFEKALQAALDGKAPGHIHTHKTDYVMTVEYRPSVHTRTNYNCFTIASMKTEELIDGKRIDAGKLLASLKDRRVSLLQEAARIEEQMEKAEIYRAQIEATKDLLNRIVNGIDYTIREIYDLDYHVQQR